MYKLDHDLLITWCEGKLLEFYHFLCGGLITDQLSMISQYWKITMSSLMTKMVTIMMNVTKYDDNNDVKMTNVKGENNDECRRSHMGL